MTELNELNIRIGANIDRLRQKQGLTISYLADIIGIGKNYLSPLLRGEKNPTVETLHKIAAALQVDVLEFFKVPKAKT